MGARVTHELDVGINQELGERILRELAEVRALLEGRKAAPQDTDLLTIEEVAEIFGKTAFTVREWCRLDRCHSVKANGGSGRQWRITRAEVNRIRTGGLLPLAST